MIGTIAIREKRGIKWDKCQIRVSEGGQVHKKMIENDRYHYDHGK
jgi:hypothetical protein